jgi:hypothetical protein
VARIRSKKSARSAQRCTCRWARCDLLVSSPATFSTSPFSGGPNARQYGPKKQTGSSAVVWRACACGAKNQRGRRKGAPAGPLPTRSRQPSKSFISLFPKFKNPGATRFVKSAIPFDKKNLLFLFVGRKERWRFSEGNSLCPVRYDTDLANLTGWADRSVRMWATDVRVAPIREGRRIRSSVRSV